MNPYVIKLVAALLGVGAVVGSSFLDGPASQSLLGFGTFLLGWITKELGAPPKKKPLDITNALIVLLALGAALPLSGCSLFRDTVIPTVVDCAKEEVRSKVSDLQPVISQIFRLDGSGVLAESRKLQLDRMAQDVGIGVLKCAIQRFMALNSPTAAGTGPGDVGAYIRAEQYLQTLGQ